MSRFFLLAVVALSSITGMPSATAEPDQTSVVAERRSIVTERGPARVTRFSSPRTGLGFLRVEWPDGEEANSPIAAFWKLEVGDVDGDGVDELLLGVWSRRGSTSFGTRRSVWVMRATTRGIEPVWRGSKLPDPFDDFGVRRRGRRDFLVTHPTGPGLESTVYRWTGFGFAVSARVARPPVRLVFVGDTALARYHDGARRVVAPSPEATGAVASADFAVANLETSVAPPGEEPSGAGLRLPRLTVRETDLQLLTSWGIDAVTRANNHALDAADGWRRTGVALRELGTAEVSDASLSVGGQKIRLIAATLHPPRAPGSSDEGPRVVSRNGEDAFVDEVATIARGSAGALVVVSLHGGREGRSGPTARMESLTRRLWDAGARVVVWHGSHRPSTVAVTDRGIAAWGLGDFALRRENRGCALSLSLNFDGSIDVESGPGRCPRE